MFLFALVYTAGTVSGMYGRGFGFLAFAILLVVLVAECVAAKGGFSTVRRIVILLILTSSAVFALAQCRYASVDEKRDSYMQYMTDEKSVIVWGKIYKTEYKYFSYRYYMTDCVVQPEFGKAYGRKISCGDVVVYNDSKSAHLGDYVKAYGKISLFKSATNEGEFDREDFYRSQGINFSVKADNINTRAGKNAWYYHRLERLRDKLSASLLGVTDETTAGVLSSMLLGDKSYLDDEIKDLYQVSGISHILAISGLHISIVGMAFYRLLRKRRVSYKTAFICSAALILSYAVMTGNAVSTRRAVGMFILTMLAAALGRCADMLNSLGIMVIYLLWENPMVLGYAGFVFSVGAILAIGIVTPVMSAPKGEKFWASVSIQLPMLPVVAMNYYELPIFAVFVNLVVIPALPVIFISGLLASVAGCVGAIPGKVLVFPAFAVLKLYELLCSLVMKLPGASVITGAPDGCRIFLFYAVMSGFLVAFSLKKRAIERGLKEKSPILYNVQRAACTAVLLAILLMKPKTAAQLDILDVGQGDGIFYRFESGTCIFIDGGSLDRKQLGENVILPFLKYNGVPGISYWFVSHADSDHISGLSEVIDSGYTIEHIVVAEAAAKEEAMDELLFKAKEAGIDICFMSKGDSIEIKEEAFGIMCLYPGTADTASDRNDMCLVLKLTDGDFSCVFGGDISAEVEKELVAEYGKELSVDFYKANHHGSKYSGSKEWIEALSPRWAAVSCAAKNRYGHPADEAMERLIDARCRIFYTMQSGQIKYKESAIYENNRQ
ncbi:DNA internalization-related competence protein ComEC/Rec2 [Agathobacter sp.]|uniref:DNA internalization-related competence protein ComEC/Rec2 n=1 Tax=Agathobacter sp. TaxID=2021311 RepID=UPI003FD734ED